MGKKITPHTPFPLQTNDTIILGENIPENDAGDSKVYADHEVPPENRCVRMRVEIMIPNSILIAPSSNKVINKQRELASQSPIASPNSDPSPPKEVSPPKTLNKKQKRMTTVVEVLNSVNKAMVHVQGDSSVKRELYRFAVKKNTLKSEPIEKIEIFLDETSTHTVDLNSWKTKRTISILKLPMIQEGLSLSDPIVTMATKIYEPLQFFQIVQDGAVVCLFDRVAEGMHHSLEFPEGSELVTSGNFKEREFKFWKIGDEEKPIGEVFGKEVESREEFFNFEISQQYDNRLGIFLMVILITLIDRGFH